MAAIDDIMELRGVLERGLAAGIADVVAVFTRQNAMVFQKDRPRVEITVSIGSATGSRRAFPDLKITRFIRWNFTGKFEIITGPANDGQNNLHALLVSHVRGFLSAAAQASWDDLDHYPNHYIAEALRDVGSPSTLKSQEGVETTSMGYSGQIGIRERAWAN